jgi:hypothetical protein
VQYVRLDQLSATADLTAYTGRYRNDDTDAVMTLRVEKGKLVAARGETQHDAVVPLFRDGFRVPSQSWVLTFQRTAEGGVSAFDLSLPRTRTLVFTRVP